MEDTAPTAFLHMTTVPTGLRCAQVLGLTSTAFLAGRTFTQTFSAVPALLHASAPLLAKQWKTMFDRDKYLAPLIVAYSSAVFGWMAYREPTLTTHSSLLHLSSLTLLLATIPYSLFLLEPLNKLLEAKDAACAFSDADYPPTEREEVGFDYEHTTHWLVDRWATVNLGRAVMSAVAAGMAIWAGVEGVKMAGVRVVSGGARMGL